jgi:hypothetical protein
VSSGALAERAGTSSAPRSGRTSRASGRSGPGAGVPRRGASRPHPGDPRARPGLAGGAGRGRSHRIGPPRLPPLQGAGLSDRCDSGRGPGEGRNGWEGTPIRDVARPRGVVEAEAIEIVILAVPATAAQPLADRAARAGVRGILNFAPVRLRLPGGRRSEQREPCGGTRSAVTCACGLWGDPVTPDGAGAITGDREADREADRDREARGPTPRPSPRPAARTLVERAVGRFGTARGAPNGWPARS